MKNRNRILCWMILFGSFGSGFGSMTALAQSEGPGFGPPPHHPPKMTDAQKKCFTDNGLEAPGPGHRPPQNKNEDPAVHEKVRECLDAQGFHPPGPPPSRNDSDVPSDDRSNDPSGPPSDSN